MSEAAEAGPAGKAAEPRDATAFTERLAAAVVVAAGLPFLAIFLRTMATTSLWADEIFSILNFSGPGPLRAATFYWEANNHVLFNVLAGAMPWRGSVDPLAARALSFAAVLGLLGLLFAFLRRRTGVFVAAVAVLVLAANQELLDLALQARGYGLASLLALGLSILAIEAVDGGGTRVLAGLAVVAVLGVWTLPTFAFFGAPLLLLVFAVRRDRPSFLAGLGALAGVVLVYAPIAGKVLETARVYDVKWGRQFGTVLAIGEVVRSYVLPSRWPFTPEVSLALLAALAAVVFAPWWRRDARTRLAGARVVLGGALSFFVLCRVMETPLLRSACFVAPVVVLVASLAVGEVWRLLPARAIVSLAASGLLLVYGVQKARHFDYLPMERWRDLSALIVESFPPGTSVHVSHNPGYLAAHLSPGRATAPPFDPEAFETGRLVVADTPLMGSDERIEAIPGLHDFAVLKLPQRMNAYQALLFAPPEPVSVAAVTDAAGRDETGLLADRDLDLAVPGDPAERLEVRLAPGRRYRSLVVVREGFGVKPELLARVTDGGPPVDVAPRWHWGDVTVVPLGDRPVARVELLPAGGAARLPRLREIWAYPLP